MPSTIRQIVAKRGKGRLLFQWSESRKKPFFMSRIRALVLMPTICPIFLSGFIEPIVLALARVQDWAFLLHRRWWSNWADVLLRRARRGRAVRLVSGFP